LETVAIYSRVQTRQCILLGAPVQEGAGRAGCVLGPSALRAAGLARVLRDGGYRVDDRGNLSPGQVRKISHGNIAIKGLPTVVAWIEAISDAVYRASADGIPIVLGGDHSVAAGTILGLSRRAADLGREFFVLWLDAHPDFHTLETTESGNLHGVPMAYATGQPTFAGIFPPLTEPVKSENICMMGIRSVDTAERMSLASSGVVVHDINALDEHGVAPLLDRFLQHVADARGMLHVSFDADFLDPTVAPGVGTAAPGGATYDQARLLMEMLHSSGLVSSLELVELNPLLDERSRTASLIVDLVGALAGRRSENVLSA
jgi:arginase